MILLPSVFIAHSETYKIYHSRVFYWGQKILVLQRYFMEKRKVIDSINFKNVKLTQRGPWLEMLNDKAWANNVN